MHRRRSKNRESSEHRRGRGDGTGNAVGRSYDHTYGGDDNSGCSTDHYDNCVVSTFFTVAGPTTSVFSAAAVAVFSAAAVAARMFDFHAAAVAA